MFTNYGCNLLEWRTVMVGEGVSINTLNVLFCFVFDNLFDVRNLFEAIYICVNYS